ncbi:hypothetical protein [Stackebrandtia nassauensis]|uniref:Uncharacterized protein n=1 Tax=Stackebrandtia nassauensis (strain DSM 44728 / CIP 108903 / NRRL B-16338 / NBRC 102104 / LLR-40K-21) TaxID=446470 RepID=D3Q4D2_STANL|nr:hypothetical protein [Stackebrandtia nassauensis]ADD40092.1 hypothetical protein Snas_0375 [Stackebrandtia nassauensis DSM 44728]
MISENPKTWGTYGTFTLDGQSLTYHVAHGHYWRDDIDGGTRLFQDRLDGRDLLILIAEMRQS